MRKMLVVAVREYQAAVRTKAFIVSLVAMPILMGGGIIAQVLLKDKVDLTDRKIAVVDHTGVLYDAVAAAAKKRDAERIFEATASGEKKQVQPRFVVEEVDTAGRNEDQLGFDLSEQVRKGGLFAFAIIPVNALEPPNKETEPSGAVKTVIDYHTNTPTYFDLPRWLDSVVNGEVRRVRLEKAGVNPQVVATASTPVPLETWGLVKKDASGKITKAQETNRAASFVAPAGLMMLMLMVVMVGASPLVQIVLEEKMQRIAEVLLGSIPPFQLMMGKLLGTVGVSLTISTVYLVGGFAAVSYAGFAPYFPTHLLWWFMVYQALAVLMYGSVFISVGAAVSDLKESQSLLTPVMVLIMAPVFVWGNVMQAPTATFAVVCSLFPPATPMLMLLRQAIPPGVPAWQPALGIVLVLLTTTLFVFAAGRVFRVGILMQGKGAKFGEMLRWAIRG